MQNEIWKDVPGYSGLYQVSNYGNIKSVARDGTKGGLLKPCKSLNGYLFVRLSNNGKVKTTYIHRIVGKVFCKNDDEQLQINHIDGNKTNNMFSNLEWVTPKENTQHCINVLHKGRKSGYENKRAKKIGCFKDGELVATFYGSRDAQRETGINAGNIASCLSNRLKTAGGYKWKYLCK